MVDDNSKEDHLWSPTTLLVALVVLLTLCTACAQFFLRGIKGSTLFPVWIARWLALSSLIVTWDASFVLLRPWSVGHPLWHPYTQYVQIDKLYGDMSDNFVYAQSLVNLVENCLNLSALRLLRKGHTRMAAVVALGTHWDQHA